VDEDAGHRAGLGGGNEDRGRILVGRGGAGELGARAGDVGALECELAFHPAEIGHARGDGGAPGAEILLEARQALPARRKKLLALEDVALRDEAARRDPPGAVELAFGRADEVLLLIDLGGKARDLGAVALDPGAQRLRSRAGGAKHVRLAAAQDRLTLGDRRRAARFEREIPGLGGDADSKQRRAGGDLLAFAHQHLLDDPGARRDGAHDAAVAGEPAGDGRGLRIARRGEEKACEKDGGEKEAAEQLPRNGGDEHHVAVETVLPTQCFGPE
jgi:hypothetical protein